MKDETIVPRMTHEFGAVFTNQGQMVLFGSVDGRAFIWDKYKGDVACVLDHCEGERTLSMPVPYLISGAQTMSFKQ